MVSLGRIIARLYGGRYIFVPLSRLLSAPPSDPPAGVQARLVGLAGGDGLLHFVVNLQDDALGAVFAVLLLVLAVGVAGNGAE